MITDRYSGDALRSTVKKAKRMAVTVKLSNMNVQARKYGSLWQANGANPNTTDNVFWGVAKWNTKKGVDNDYGGIT